MSFSDQNPSSDDQLLREGVLAGLKAGAEMERRFRKSLERLLLGRCGRGDGRSHEKAVEIAGQVLADCYIKSPSLLEKWSGEENLEAFLRTVAVRRLLSWWKSADYKYTHSEHEGASAQISDPSVPEEMIFPEETEAALRGMRAGVAAAAEQCPEGLVFLRLKMLHGVEQRALAECWGHHESQTSRRVREAMRIIREAAAGICAASGQEFTVYQALAAMRLDPGVLLGPADGGMALEPAWDSLLRKVAEGPAGKADLAEATALMKGDPRALAYFAELLNRRAKDVAVFVRDPALSGARARLRECARHSLISLPAMEAMALVDNSMRDYFREVLEHMGAEGGTLWLLTPGEAVLTAICNPLEPSFSGRRQPLASGIISFVLVTGESVQISKVQGDPRYSPLTDLEAGRETEAMVAVPFTVEGQTRGVLSAVRFRGSSVFPDQALNLLTGASSVLARLLSSNLMERILRD